MAAQRRKEEAEAFRLATQQALISAPASPTKSSPQRITNLSTDNLDDDTDCHLLRLSQEIRSRIYYYAMDNQFHALLDPSRHRYSDGVKTRSKTPALMRTCSQLRIEASNIWYSETIFVYKLDSVLYQWLQLIGPVNQKLLRTVRRDSISLTKRWAEAYVVFTHARLQYQNISLAEDAIEVAFWEPQGPAPPVIEETVSNAALAVTASAALEQVFQSDDLPQSNKLLVDDAITGGVFEFDPDVELEDFAENLLENIHDGNGTASNEFNSIDGDVSSISDSKSTATSASVIVKCAEDDDGKKKKKAKKSAKSSASSVAESTTSAKDLEKKQKALKKKDSPSSLAESVMSTKSGKGDKPKDKKPAKHKVKKEPEPEKTWAFVRMETVSV